MYFQPEIKKAFEKASQFPYIQGFQGYPLTRCRSCRSCVSCKFLVNRKILEKQLQEELDDIANEYDLSINIKDYIYISTYQKIENLLATNSYEIKRFYGFTFVVYDECHYFFCDAAFNTLTELSYDFLRNTYCQCVQIFLSATMDNIFPILQKRKEIYLGTDTEYRLFNKKNYI